MIAKKMIKFKLLEANGFLKVIFNVADTNVRYMIKQIDSIGLASFLAH